ncbi:Uncharacterised protein [Vibrio cholerae]|nr:Uncharacterised protein [Vibrio cholerae]CSH91335.1 Uncharacterised protein [Vibrio cholerae]
MKLVCLGRTYPAHADNGRRRCKAAGSLRLLRGSETVPSCPSDLRRWHAPKSVGSGYQSVPVTRLTLYGVWPALLRHNLAAQNVLAFGKDRGLGYPSAVHRQSS